MNLPPDERKVVAPANWAEIEAEAEAAGLEAANQDSMYSASGGLSDREETVRKFGSWSDFSDWLNNEATSAPFMFHGRTGLERYCAEAIRLAGAKGEWGDITEGEKQLRLKELRTAMRADLKDAIRHLEPGMAERTAAANRKARGRMTKAERKEHDEMMRKVMGPGYKPAPGCAMFLVLPFTVILLFLWVA